MNAVTLRARAKVNLHLRVLGKRADGYHELETVFDRISLADTLTLERRPEPGIVLSSSGSSVPADPSNLAWRGAAAALAAGGEKEGLAIRLEKGVPAGAGLGGGSADAAAALVGVNALFGLELDESTLLSIGRRIGADVPFFVHGHLRDREREGLGRMAAGTGVGEALRPVRDPPSLHYLMVNPGFEVSTAWVFQAGRWGPVSGENAALTTRSDQGRMDGAWIDGGASFSLEDALRLLENDLEKVTASRHPEVLEMRKALLSVGALGARMSGSGPTVFGVFETGEEAARAGGELERRYAGTPVRIFVARGE